VKTTSFTRAPPLCVSGGELVRFFCALFLLATVLALLILAVLVLDVANNAFGYVAIQNRIDPKTLIDQYFKGQPLAAPSMTTSAVVSAAPVVSLDTMSREDLLAILATHISTGRLRALNAMLAMTDRTRNEIQGLVVAEVVRPEVVESWSFLESVFQREAIEVKVASMPNAVMEFRSWLTWSFITSPQSSDPTAAGVFTAILGSLWVTLIAFLVSVPLGVGAATYLEEFSKGSKLDGLIETNINNLAGVPSIIYGMLGLAVFVRFFGQITSGIAFGAADPSTANGRTILSAGLTLGLLILPLVIINAREAIRTVPKSLREGAYGLGATQWQTVWSHVLRYSLPGILTGVILSVSRAFGETAPLIGVGVSTFIVVNPGSPFAKFTTLPVQIYQWISRPQEEFQRLAAAGILVLLFLLLAVNATAIILRNHFSRRY
jgi:phosphate transport system permease protein